MKEYFKLFSAFFKIGLFTIGGGLAMLPLIQKAVVEDYKWMEDEEMVDCLAICQSMPGVIAINAATYIGYKRKGFAGSLFATLGVILPSFIIIILAAIFLKNAGSNPRIQGAFTAVKAASCALILYAAVNLGAKILKDKISVCLALAAFAAIAVFDVKAFWAIVVGAAVGLLPYYIRKGAKG